LVSKDFTFVCPTELHAFQDALPNLKKKYNRNWCFLRYKRSTFCLVKYCKNNGGIEGVTYPILADTNRNLSNILGILDIESTEYSEETDSVMVEGKRNL
jgi:peroxiredoxin (alkyl hydroperoxide reductase subunit C)